MRACLVPFVFSIGLLAQGRDASSWFRVPQIVFDEARDRLTVFTPDYVREWDGSRWGDVSVVGETAVFLPVYVPWDGRVFGGRGEDLVVFDGHSITAIAPLPNDRVRSLLVDPASSELIAISGRVGGGAEQYRLSRITAGDAWQRGVDVPSTGSYRAAAFDEARGVVVVELYSSASASSETWEWQGGTWVLAGTHTSTPRRNMAFDPIRQRVVCAGPGYLDELVGGAWLPHPAAAGPPAADLLTADRAGQRVFTLSRDTTGRQRMWQLDASGWQALGMHHPPHAPNGLSNAHLTFDSVRGRALLHGPMGLFEFDGEAWIEPPGYPLAGVFGTAYAYDAARQQLVVFGGHPPLGASSGITWTWDGAVWRQASTTGPSPRSNAKMAYDSVRQRIVLVDGQEHWEWDGVAWQAQAAIPFFAGHGAIGYDPSRARLVYADSRPSAVWSVWEYDGSVWSQVLVNSLWARESRLTWNGLTQRLRASMGLVAPAGEYEWDGATWTLVSDEVDQVAYDSGRGGLLIFERDSLRIENPNLAAVSSYGQSCDGPRVNTSLAAFGLPTAGASTLRLMFRAEVGAAPIGYAFGTGRANIPIGNGCAFLLQGAFATVFAQANGNGIGELPVSLPASTTFYGTILTVQAATVSGAVPGGIAVSQGLELEIGH